jgi:hypothetical protein
MQGSQAAYRIGIELRGQPPAGKISRTVSPTNPL